MMKKMILMIVAMLSITTSYAENENATRVNNVEAYDMSVNMRKLGETHSPDVHRRDALCSTVRR